jgi:hypothetical protein
MPKLRRVMLLIGVLLLMGEVHSYMRGIDLLNYYPPNLFSEAYSFKGNWGLTAFRQPSVTIPAATMRHLGAFNIAVRGGEFWRIDVEGKWLQDALLVLIAAFAFEIRARRRRNSGAGFEVGLTTPPTRAT